MAAVIALLLSLLALLACGQMAPAVEPAAVLAELHALSVAPEHRCSDYDRDDYPYPQTVEAQIAEHLGGIWSPYTLREFSTLEETQIEHMVALSEAHDSGLCGATAATRRAFAKDLDNLTLASPEVNRAKSGHDAAEWLPEHNRCWFAGRVVAVRAEYGLTIDSREYAELERVLGGCKSVDLVGVAIEPEPEPEPEPGHPPVRSFSNCTEMRNAGWYRGVRSTGGTYRDSWDTAERNTYNLNKGRDRDKDGHACE